MTIFVGILLFAGGAVAALTIEHGWGWVLSQLKAKAP